MDCHPSFHPPRPRRTRLDWRIGRIGMWCVCLGLGLGAGLALGWPEGRQALADAAQDGDASPKAALEMAYGAPCADGPQAPPVALIAPLDGYYQRFAQAVCDGAAGRLDAAAAGFRSGLEEPVPVPALWHWRLVQTLVLAGNHDAAVAELGTLVQMPISPLLRERVRDLVSALQEESGPVPAGRRADYLLAYLEHVTPEPEDYDLLLRLWESLERGGDAGQRDALRVLLWRNAKDEESAMAWSDVPRQAPEGAIAAADYYARSERLFRLRMYEQLARELERADFPELEPTYAKSLGRLYFRALIHGRLLSHAAVQVNTGSVMRRFAFDRRQQLIWAIRIQLRRRLIGPVLKYLEELEQLSPKDEALPQIYLELLKYNQGRRDTVTMMHWLERIVTHYGDSAEASEAYWQVIWDAIERRAYDEALPLLDAAIAQSGAFHPVDQARLLYWRGRVLMNQGDTAAGEASWKEMADRWPYNYYTAMAEWVQDGNGLAVLQVRHDVAPERHEAPRVQVLWGIEPFPAGLFLFAVGEPDLATELLGDVVTRKMSPEALEEAGALFHYMGRHYLQLRLMANHLLDRMRGSEVSDTKLWRRAFPRPHWDVVRAQAEAQEMDPYFVFAIMREESRFFTTAYSHAGAKGLMQLMPSTARMVAKRNGLRYDEDLLHTPEFNIPLGTLYLKRVLTRFDGNPFYAAAAYNAGPGNVRRWLRHYGSLPLDEFVERIPFGETQRYVKRVFLSYRVYTKLYR